MRRVQTAMEIKMQMIMAILSLALLMLVDEASAQKTYSVSVSRHASLKEPLSEKEVRNILKDASAMEGRTHDLLSCCRTFGRYSRTSR
jgi:hypothetical protein